METASADVWKPATAVKAKERVSSNSNKNLCLEYFSYVPAEYVKSVVT
jgi:hypothetical protein